MSMTMREQLMERVNKSVRDKPKKLMAVNSEGKAFEWLFEGSSLVIKIDPNKDGEPVAEIKLNLSEVPDEILSVIF